jgi:hypothetical protein
MDIGKSIIFLGFSLICVGCFFYLLGDRMNWFGNLLGDFKYESKNIRVYMPQTHIKEKPKNMILFPISI